MNLLFNIKSLHTKTNSLTYIEMMKQTVKNYKIINLFINKIRKRKINLIIPERCDHDLIIPNYSNLGF